MRDQVLAALFVIGIWWLSTGAILVLNGLPRTTVRGSVTGASVLAVLGLVGLVWTSRSPSPSAAYLAFLSAIAIWGWHELVFLLGLVTGPRKQPCPPDAVGWSRFGYATAVVIHHEVVLVLTVMAAFGLTWGMPNQVGTWVLAVLWIMRLSAKLNIFLGVPNVNIEFIPDHLKYMVSYFKKARLNALMPVSILLGGCAVFRLAVPIFSSDPADFLLVGNTIVATLLALAVLEHIFMAAPMKDAFLWRWAQRGRNR